MLKIPPSKVNTGNFKSVPREFINRQQEKEDAKYPSVGVYRPRHQYTQPNIKGRVQFKKDYKAKFDQQESSSIKKHQFDEGSKLCMCILRALDQETVDLKKNRDLQNQIFLTEKSQRKIRMMSNLIQQQ
jgi:hypothetical protein